MYPANESTELGRSGVLASCMARVYWWMTLALTVSGIAAFIVGTSKGLGKVFFNPPVFMGIAIAELALVVIINMGIGKLSAAVAMALFMLYATINGITLSCIFMVYTMTSIVQVFAITAATFAVMAVVGTVTKRDLSSLGNILFMALLGLIIASIVNLFWRNDMLYWIVSCAGVLIFVGLTAYDANKIKMMLMEIDPEDREAVGKVAVIGALQLYLDFVNLLLYLLRLFGRRK